jgi:hypothetical protein
VKRAFSEGGIFRSHIHNRFTHQTIRAVVYPHYWSHAGFADFIKQTSEPTLQDEYSEEQKGDEARTLQTVMEGFQLVGQGISSASRGYRRLRFHPGINIYCVTAELYVKVLYIACRSYLVHS